MAKTVTNSEVIAKLLELYKDAFQHDGYGDIRIEMRFLRKGQKEIIIHCGKQYRFVLDYPAHPNDLSGLTDICGRIRAGGKEVV